VRHHRSAIPSRRLHHRRSPKLNRGTPSILAQTTNGSPPARRTFCPSHLDRSEGWIGKRSCPLNREPQEICTHTRRRLARKVNADQGQTGRRDHHDERSNHRCRQEHHEHEPLNARHAMHQSNRIPGRTAEEQAETRSAPTTNQALLSDPRPRRVPPGALAPVVPHRQASPRSRAS